MKKVFIVLIVLLLLLPSGKSVVTDLSAEETEGYAYAGTFMMSPVKQKINPDDKPDDKPTECKCSNGKISYDGGTSFTDCTCKLGKTSCGCQHSAGQEPVTEAPKEEALLPRIVLITQPYNKQGKPNCVPCINVENNIVAKLKNDSHKKSGWDVGTTDMDDLQVLDLNNEDSLAKIEKLGLDFDVIPTFFFMRKDGTKTKVVGSMPYEEFIKKTKESK